MWFPDADVSSLARELEVACALLAEADADGRATLEPLVLERIGGLLNAMGKGIHTVASGGAKVRGNEPAFRVEAVTDYVVKDVTLAAAMARSRSEKLGLGLCTYEPLETDPLGVLSDLLALEIPMRDMAGLIEVILQSMTMRSLSASERRSE